jgi:hypothetical protein
MGGWLLSCGKHKINFLMEFLKSPRHLPHFTTEPLDKIKKKNKSRAAQILRILRVDEPSIKKILKMK